MPIENNPQYIDDLNATYPYETDPLGQIDDHLKNIKAVIKQTFPNIDGPVTATQADLNEAMVVPGILGDNGTPTLNTGITGDEIKTLIGVVEPAITTDGSSPSLASGITAEEMRTLIGAKDASIVTPGILDIYPVGSIYMTMDNNFDPNVTFGGNWDRFAAGRMPIGVDANDNDFMNLGENSNFQGGGAKEVVITEDQMPTHKHGSNLRLEGAANGNILIDNSLYYDTGVYGREIDELSENNYGDSTYTMTAGNDEAHPNMPPFIVVAMWQRMPDTP